jgi:hypothetical protein
MGRFLSNLWRRKYYLENRTRHQEMDDIFGRVEIISGFKGFSGLLSGLYLISYGVRIV